MIKLTVEYVGSGKDSLNGKKADGLTVAIGDGKAKFLSWKSLKMLLSYLAETQNGLPEEPK